MKHGQKYRQQRIQPTGPLVLCGIKIMENSHMFDYSQLHRSAFLESKCNFRLALMYYKSFLSPLFSCMDRNIINKGNMEYRNTMLFQEVDRLYVRINVWGTIQLENKVFRKCHSKCKVDQDQS